MVSPPPSGQVHGDLRVVVAHDLAGPGIHDWGDGDAAVIAGITGQIGLLQPLDARHRIASTQVEVERPAPPS